MYVYTYIPINIYIYIKYEMNMYRCIYNIWYHVPNMPSRDGHAMEILPRCWPLFLGGPNFWTTAKGFPVFQLNNGDGSKPWYLVNPKIAGKWMFIRLKYGIYRYWPIPKWMLEDFRELFWGTPLAHVANKKKWRSGKPWMTWWLLHFHLGTTNSSAKHHR
jgi:hypothetical protein